MAAVWLDEVQLHFCSPHSKSTCFDWLLHEWPQQVLHPPSLTLYRLHSSGIHSAYTSMVQLAVADMIKIPQSCISYLNCQATI